MAQPPSKHTANKSSASLEGKFGSSIESALSSIIVDHEYATAKSNNDQEYAEFENLLDLMEGNRAEKNADWKSDIHIPLFFSHLASEASQWATQMFSTRDFCNVYLEGRDPGDLDKCEATKVCINKTLNMPQIYHYAKYIRGRMLNWMFGQSYLVCYWEYKDRPIKIQQPPITQPEHYIDESTGQINVRSVQIPQPPIESTRVVYDRFNYDIVDPRNVFSDYSYTYSIQQKPWVIIQSEATLQRLEAEKVACDYFNLDILKERLHSTSSETVTAAESYNKDGQKSPFSRTPLKSFDTLTRFGTIPAIVEEYDEDDNPIKARPGYDDNGEVLGDAEMIECIVTFAIVNGDSTLIRFQPTPFIDSNGEPYKPLIRTWCYIHPTKDTGLSDGKNLHEINVAIDDTFNISNDRVMLATLPVLKGRKAALDDNPTVFIAPDHIIELEDPDRDLKELVIRDNIVGAMNQITVLEGWASKADAIFNPQLGGMPDKTSVTATASAAGEAHSNARGGFKSLTYEYTGQAELYRMILQMTWRFAKPETALKMMDDLAYKFDPDGDYAYIPVSQALEDEHNKARKVQTYDQMMGRITGLAPMFPKEIAQIVAWIIGKQAVEMGSEFQEVAPLIMALAKAQPQLEQPQGTGQSQPSDMNPEAMSNQNGIPQSTQESGIRSGSTIAGEGSL